jgi:L-phenylalanine/L-methionine N-acetyltransferase
MTRKITETDFEFIYKLYFHPAINPYLLYEMMPKEAFWPIFQDLLAQDIIHIFEADGQAVGMFKLIPLQHRTSHINYLGGVAIDPDFSGKGYGSKMLEAIIDLGQQRGIKRLELSTATFNEKAIQLYKKHGFELEGVLRNYTFLKSENRFIDEQMMAYLY